MASLVSLRAQASARYSSAADDVFRRRGHEVASIDPLGLWESRADGGSGIDAAREAASPGVPEAYTGSIGFEFSHCETEAERSWWAAAAESRASGGGMSSAQRRNAHLLMTQAEEWELFLAKRFASLKRYSGEGAESMLPLLDHIAESSSQAGVGEIVVGMPHRGRLATLVSFFGYPASKLFRKLQGGADLPAAIPGQDDVSSHVAASTTRSYGRKSVRVSMLHNPSHLEAVNPVAMGKTRAKRDGAGARSPWAGEPSSPAAQSGPAAGSPDAMCVLVHGDGAVSGQGVVWESLAMSRLPGFGVGGTVHVVVNNQVAFTAARTQGRSSSYCTDIAKGVSAPVLHVNGEDLEAVAWAGRTAVRYRQEFGRDVFIDLVTYRRHGHNELDQPRFTQPDMYAAIEKRPTLPRSFAADLEADGELPAGRDAALRARLAGHLKAEHAAAADWTAETGTTGVGPDPFGDAGREDVPATGLVTEDGSAFGGKWAGIHLARPGQVGGSAGCPDGTGVAADQLLRYGRASVEAEGRAHEHLERGHIAQRAASLDEAAADPSAEVLSWATAEAMAFASLLDDGFDVRISGQDVERGTFSHRHAVFTCPETGAKTTPLGSRLGEAAGRFHPVSSHLSEFACMGFELGYSMESPGALCLWEAQFGDFANGAQIIIDQFVTGTESKWLRQSALTLLLPHGFDGAGPEHSSAHMERFLQLVNTPAWSCGGRQTDVRDIGSAAGEAFRGLGSAYAGSAFADAAAGWTPEGVAAGTDDKTLAESANFSVCQPSTPASYFHMLRRQMVRPFRKPLVVVAPKTLLRLPAARSSLESMGTGTTFRPVRSVGAWADPSAVKTLLLCSGRMAYEVERIVSEAGADSSTAVVCLEEIAPFPMNDVAAELSRFSGLENAIWVQEEPANAGAWSFVQAHLGGTVRDSLGSDLGLVSRPASATTAIGVSSLHKIQQQRLEHDLRAYLATE